MFLFQQGLFFPLFYIQVDAVSHNLNQTFSFYTVSHFTNMNQTFEF